MLNRRSYRVVWLFLVTGCMGRHEPPQLVIPLSADAAISSPGSPGIGVRLTFNGETAWFVFDTGAGAHTLARWFVESAGLPMDSGSAGVAGRDASGSPVQLLVVHGLLGQLDDGGILPVGTGVVADFPPMFESARIGGLINPQLLAHDANAVVLDLRVPELRIESFDRAVRRLGATVLAEEDLEVCVSTAAAIPNRLFAIRVTSGQRDGWLQLDTGAGETSISHASQLVEGVALEPGGTTMGVAGQPQTYDLARDLVLTFAGHSVTTSAHVVERPGGTCGPDGLLGLDALGRCALVLGREAVAFACSRSNALPARSPQPGGVELDIPFVQGGRHDQQLDLYTPSDPGFPTILFVHGGGLTSGNRKDEPYAQMCQAFRASDIACATTGYRLAPSHKWPAQPNDVASAFRWLKENIGARGGDPGRIFLFGHSSGCLLGSIVAADARYLEAQGLDPEDVAGLIAMGCRLDDHVEVTDIPPSRHEASWVPPNRVADYIEREAAFVSLEQRNAAVPAAHVSERLPPTLVLIAEAERFFPPILRDAAEFVGRALARGVDAELVLLENRRHMTAIRMMVTTDDPAVVRVIEFVRAH